ncbi:MAG: extracellular solute-binding protein [Spirochaetales bacterium]|nr:extracellular solute-binding protein [Spirochaetales bacterium]
MKKVLIGALTVLAVSSAPVWANGGAEEGDSPVKISTYHAIDVPEDDAVVLAIEEAVGIDLDISTTSHGQYWDSLDLRIAAGDFPDVYKIRDEDTYALLYEDGLIENISALAEEMGAENLLAHLQRPTQEKYADANGNFYRIPNWGGAMEHAMYVRQDWLDQLGLELPKTYDDFRDMLQAFVDADLDGTNTEGFVVDNWWLIHVRMAFTGYNTWKVDGGNVEYELVSDGYKDYLKYIAGLYQDGLIDPEFFTYNLQAVSDKFVSGQAGVTFKNGSEGTFNELQKPLKQNFPNAKLGAIVPFPEGPAGAYKWGNNSFSYAQVVINSALPEAKKRKIVEFLDYMVSPEGIALGIYGIEGIHHDVVDGKIVPNQDVMDQEWGGGVHVLGDLIFYGSRIEKIQNPIIRKNLDFAETNALITPIFEPTTDEALDLKAKLKEVYKSYRAKFMVGELDVDEGWDEYIEAMEAVGLSRYIEIIRESL